MIPITVTILAMLLSAGLGIFLGWLVKRPEKPKRWPNGSSCHRQHHEGAYISEWTPESVQRYRRVQ